MHRYHRWGYRPDQRHRSGTLARGMLEGHPLRALAPLLAIFTVRRMVPRMAFAGANANNAPILIESFANLVEMLEEHLKHRPYLFGHRPAFGDFGLWGQLYQAYMDPTCGAHLTERGTAVVAWLNRMLAPKLQGDFEALESPKILLGWIGVSTDLKTLPQRVPGALRAPPESPPHQNLFDPRTSPETLWIHWVQESPGGARGRGIALLFCVDATCFRSKRRPGDDFGAKAKV